MKAGFFIILLITIVSTGIWAQNPAFQFPGQQLEALNNSAIQRIRSEKPARVVPVKNEGPVSGVSQVQSTRKELSGLNIRVPASGQRVTTSDTLYITDTLVITGSWIHEGAIVIAYSGMLRFVNAHATILGDIFLLGEHPSLIADSSTLYIPQAYFYQRVVFATGGAEVSLRNSTVDHSGLSHNIILVDSARLELINVTNVGFTTNGIYGQSAVFVNGTNEAGEYVILDESNLEFRNAHTVLLWHQFPEGSSVDFTFPKGDTIDGYHFSNALPGISGPEYQIKVDSSYNLMWGLMPGSGTDVTISGSEIRSIGLWFMGSDTIQVSGLVDNSTYALFDAPLSDRTLRLVNSSVTTWSLYPMEHSYVNLSDCIVGEVGTGGHSTLMGQQFFCDGSGGYVWASDSSLMINGFSFVSGYVRSQAHGMLVYAYSSLAAGYPSALHYSMMMVLQCTLPADPVALDKSVVWFAYIDKPFDANAGSVVPITGSAWIDKPNSSTWMEFGSYHLYYQPSESTAWIEIPADSLHEKRDEVLANWNTTGLQAGQYLLKLEIKDSWGNSAIALKGIMLQPTFAVDEIQEYALKLYPNPANNRLYLELPENCTHAVVRVTDIVGNTLIIKNIKDTSQHEPVELSLQTLQPGCYTVRLEYENKCLLNKVMVQ